MIKHFLLVNMGVMSVADPRKYRERNLISIAELQLKNQFVQGVLLKLEESKNRNKSYTYIYNKQTAP